MCGIAGIISFEKRIDVEILKNMTDVLSDRGPDGSGYEIFESPFGQIGFGHRRLSIIELSELGSQPMTYNNLSIVFNGEIYNYKQLKAQLLTDGYKFNSDSDTEVILASYQKWGNECFNKFKGMFALVIFDSVHQKIVCARDRAGVKPFFFYQNQNEIIFSSDIRSFHKFSNFQKSINVDALSDYLRFGYVSTPNCIFDNTFKLDPGHILEIDLKTKIQKKIKYWDVNDLYLQSKSDISFEEAASELELILTRAFEYRMVSDVPVGIFLSGGYDSTAVAALLQKNASQKLKTYTIGFEDPKYNEANHAKAVAEHIGTDHTEVYCTIKDAFNILPNISDIYSEPFADSSAIPTTLVSRIAREHVKVSLSADGGDEVFAGYNKHLYALKFNKVFNNLPSFFKKAIGNSLELCSPIAGKLLSDIYIRKYLKTKNLFQNSSQNILKEISSTFIPKDFSNLLIKEISDMPNTNWSRDQNLFGKIGFLDAMLALDWKTYMVEDILVKVDRATMSVGLEGREPFLDEEIIKFAASLPESYKYDGQTTKRILKHIVHKYVPKKIMDRPKMGFGLPIGEFLRTDLKDLLLDTLSVKNIRDTGFLNANYIIKERDEFLKYGNISDFRIYFIFILVQWHKRWM